MQELQNTGGLLPVEFIQVASGFRQNFDAPHKERITGLGGRYSDAGIVTIAPSISSRAVSRFSSRWFRGVSGIDAVLPKEPRQRYRTRLSSLEVLQSLVGDLRILKIFEVFNDRLSGAVGFRSPGALGKALQAFFDFLGKGNSQHRRNLCAKV